MVTWGLGDSSKKGCLTTSLLMPIHRFWFVCVVASPHGLPAGPKFPNQGLNWAPAAKGPSLNPWTSGEFPVCLFVCQAAWLTEAQIPDQGLNPGPGNETSGP